MPSGFLKRGCNVSVASLWMVAWAKEIEDISMKETISSCWIHSEQKVSEIWFIPKFLEVFAQNDFGLEKVSSVESSNVSLFKRFALLVWEVSQMFFIVKLKEVLNAVSSSIEGKLPQSDTHLWSNKK
jgi:hypothetical protein